eukprot:CAMPEP_0172184892 /NCGR_PEP_ID=MMETSP1050-20130122/19844_1 /TAXON_ID=233186 /ORGANISM="Cryptomonas curvata, Strain CCAP979/52" /LENGTH=123 /DNA_ID=CAMNT_0012858773 /DNA_START=127 /DNA_END=499 /DNA_ORIENTATION=-
MSISMQDTSCQPPEQSTVQKYIELMAPPPRKYVVPEGGSVRRSRTSARIEPITFHEIDTEGGKSSAASPSLASLASPLAELSRSLSSVQLQRLASIPNGLGDESHGEKIGLLFTDAAHSVLDQ